MKKQKKKIWGKLCREKKFGGRKAAVVLAAAVFVSLLTPFSPAVTAHAETIPEETAEQADTGNGSEGTEQKVVRVAFPEQAGMSYIGHTGKVSGYNYDYLEKISEYTGWKMEYVAYENEDGSEAVVSAMNDLMDGKVDLMGPLLKNAQTEEMFEFPENSYGTVYTTLCALVSGGLRETNLQNQKSLRVGLWKQAETRNAEVSAFLESSNIDYEIIYFDSSEEQRQALEDGSVDVISALSLSPAANTRIVAQFAARPYYFASTKGNSELIHELDATIQKIDQVQPMLQESLYDNYFRNADDVFTLTDSQRDSLAKMDELKVLCTDYDAPYVYQKDGEPAGMMISLINDLSEELGIPVEYTFCSNREEADEQMKETDFDMLVGFPLASSYCAANGFIRSEPVLESALVFVQNPANPERNTIAIVKGMEDFMDLSSYSEVLVYDDVRECIEAVKSKRADLAAGNRSVVEYYLYESYSSLVTSLISGQTQDVCIAISKNCDLNFMEVLNYYISSLSNLSKTAYLSEGNMHSSSASLMYFIRLHPVGTIAFISVMILILASGIFMLLYAKQMNRKNEELRVANEAKSEFLSRMSHDIRTPMNGILGMLELADRNADDPQTVRKYHAKIQKASEYLMSLINDVLDMSRLESGKATMKTDSVYLHNLLISCRDIMENRAEEAGITLRSPNLEKFFPPRVKVNEKYLRQILVNLIGNAIKYNKPNGEVVVKPEILSQTADAVTCRLTVSDTGIGISEEFQRRMFEPFAQEEEGARGEYKGTGLGLSIVKRIVDQMGGEIQVTSRKGEGTSISCILTFAIDKCAPEADNRQEKEEVRLDGCRILAAEDNELNAEILQFILEDAGAEVVLEKDGEKAVQAFENSPEGTFDYILTDIMMPKMDGYEVCRTIRSMKRTDASIPIIALTANAFAEDTEKIMRAGMNAHITKPLDIDKLKKCLAELKTSSEQEEQNNG